MFEELRTAYQSCTRVHIDLTKSVSRFGLINIRAWPQRNLNLDFSASCWHKIRDGQFWNDGALHACCLLSWYSFKRAWYKLHFDRCSRSSADSAYLNWTRCTVVLFESWRLNKTILGAFPLIWFGLMAFKTFGSNYFLESIVLVIDPSVCAKVCGIARWKILWQQQNKCIRNILHVAKFVWTPKNIISERSSPFRYCFSELDLDNVDSWEM